MVVVGNVEVSQKNRQSKTKTTHIKESVGKEGKCGCVFVLSYIKDPIRSVILKKEHIRCYIFVCVERRVGGALSTRTMFFFLYVFFPFLLFQHFLFSLCLALSVFLGHLNVAHHHHDLFLAKAPQAFCCDQDFAHTLQTYNIPLRNYVDCTRILKQFYECGEYL
jgi:hypothetical protein